MTNMKITLKMPCLIGCISNCGRRNLLVRSSNLLMLKGMFSVFSERGNEVKDVQGQCSVSLTIYWCRWSPRRAGGDPRTPCGREGAWSPGRETTTFRVSGHRVTIAERRNQGDGGRREERERERKKERERERERMSSSTALGVVMNFPDSVTVLNIWEVQL